MMITKQQRWNRYVNAINFCISQGYYIKCVDSKGVDGKWNGNERAIIVKNFYGARECIIRLKTKKYKPMELYLMIVEKIGLPNADFVS